MPRMTWADAPTDHHRPSPRHLSLSPPSPSSSSSATIPRPSSSTATTPAPPLPPASSATSPATPRSPPAAVPAKVSRINGGATLTPSSQVPLLTIHTPSHSESTVSDLSSEFPSYSVNRANGTLTCPVKTEIESCQNLTRHGRGLVLPPILTSQSTSVPTQALLPMTHKSGLFLLGFLPPPLQPPTAMPIWTRTLP